VANVPLTFLAIGPILAGLAIALASRPITGAVMVDRLLSWSVLVNIGVTDLVNFVFHVFFGQMSAAFIGWADSPLQFEVGTASLGFASASFIAAFGSFDRQLIAIIGQASSHWAQPVGTPTRW